MSLADLRRAFASLSEGHTEPGARAAHGRARDRLLRDLFLEYEVQTQDRRLYAQSMMAMAGFVMAAFAALSAAWAQSSNPAPLVLIAPLMLAGGEGVLVLRVHLLRVSVYLTLVEEDIRECLGVPTRPVAWETTMTGRIGAAAGLSSPGRSAPGLSIAMILGAGILGATFFVLVGLAALDSTKTTALTDWLPGSRGQQEGAYVALNLFLIGLLAVTWLRQAKALEVAHEQFKRIRSGASLD